MEKAKSQPSLLIIKHYLHLANPSRQIHMMHITGFLVLVTALISAATPSPAALPQTAEIDIHLELKSKDVTGSFNEHNAKQDPNYDAKLIGPSLAYSFRLKGYLHPEFADPLLPPLPPPPYYQFKKGSYFEQGILSRDPTIFRLEKGKLVVGNKEVGLSRPFEKGPAAAILLPRDQGLNFTTEREIGGERLHLLRIVEPRFCEPKLTFQGDRIHSGPGSLVNINFVPRE